MVIAIPATIGAPGLNDGGIPPEGREALPSGHMPFHTARCRVRSTISCTSPGSAARVLEALWESLVGQATLTSGAPMTSSRATPSEVSQPL